MDYLVLSFLLFASLQGSNCTRSEKASKKISLIVAVKKSSPKAVSERLRQGNDPNSKDCYGTPVLHWAAYYDTKGPSMKLLLDNGAEIDAKDRDGWIALDWASRIANTTAITQLIQKAIEQNKITIKGAHGATLLHYAAALGGKESHTMVKQLLALGLDPNAQDDTGCTPLHKAAANTKIDIKAVASLVKAGALTSIRNNSHKVPLDVAKSNDIWVLLWLHGKH